MGSIVSIYNSGFYSTYNYENKIYQPLTDNNKYSTIKINNIPFPINIINDSNSKRCAIMIFINVGYFIESQNIKYDNYIKIFLEIIFERNNKFNELFSKYNLKYYNKIDIEKTVIYFEFDYFGFEEIVYYFIKTIINIDNLLIQNDPNKLINIISIANDTDCNYILYKRFIENILIKINNDNKKINENNNNELKIEEFFQYYFLKNENIYITILSPYKINICKKILNTISDNLKYEIKRNLIKRYEKYKGNEDLNAKIFTFNDIGLLMSSKIDISNNNILKLIFFFPKLKFEEQNILEYLVYMLKGKRPGSLYYDLYKRKYISDLNVYSVYNINIPSQLIIKIKLFFNFSFYNFSLNMIIAKLINYLRKLKSDKNLIKITYENYQKILLQNFIFKNNNYNTNYYNELFNITNNSIILQNKYQNNNNNYINLLSNKYILPYYNDNIIEEIINQIMSLNNFFIIVEMFPRSFNTFILNNKSFKMNNLILNNIIEINEYNTNITAKINKNGIFNYANMTQIYDNPMFRHYQDKKCYLSKDYNLIKNNNNFNNIQLALNNIANKLWYQFDYNIKYPKIYSSFHIIYPNIRFNRYNHIPNIYSINLKYFNHLYKKIQIEFEELFDINNINFNNDYYINLSKDENGLNLEINTFQDVYLIIIQKIFSFIFEFENNYIEYTNVDYNENIFKDEISQALWYLKQVIKKDINEKYFKDKNKYFNINEIKEYANEIIQNIYIDGLLYGYINYDIIKEVKNILFTYNTREYDNFSFFTDIPDFKKRLYEYKQIKESNIHIFKCRQGYVEDNLNYYLSFYQLIDCDNNKELFIIIIYLLLKIYIPQCEIYKIFTDNIYYLLIFKKCFDNPEFSAKHITINIKKFVDIINNKSNIELYKILLSIKDDIENEINNFNNKYNYIWQEIYYDKYNFDKHDNLKEYYNKYFTLKNNEWINEFKTFLKDNLFDKKRKVEFLFYKELLNFNIIKDVNCYPWNFYKDYSLKINLYNYISYINEEK